MDQTLPQWYNKCATRVHQGAYQGCEKQSNKEYNEGVKQV